MQRRAPGDDGPFDRVRVAHGHDEIAGRDERCKAIDIVQVVDIVEMLDTHPDVAGDGIALGRGVAILQINETAIWQFQ